jgi:hypothetical protein
MLPPKSGRTEAGIGGDAANADDSRRIPTMAELTSNPGFAPPKPEQALTRRRAAAIELIATLALTVSLVVAATAVSLGNKSFARAELAGRPAAQMPVARQ